MNEREKLELILETLEGIIKYPMHSSKENVEFAKLRVEEIKEEMKTLDNEAAK